MDCNCEGCGANLEYLPGSNALSCQYCGHQMVFEAESAGNVHKELDLDNYLDKIENASEVPTQPFIDCNDCGAKTQLENSNIAGDCPFCSAPLVLSNTRNERLIKPASLLPFGMAKDQAQSNAHHWIKKRWFAPNDFKKLLNQKQRFRGVYLPFWTYDCSTNSQYVGQRGRHYYESVSNGKGGTRRVRKTRWSMTSGRVACAFDDLLVPATASLPNSKLDALEPWDLSALEDYEEDYLRGFTAEAYQIDLRAGYQTAKSKMEDHIRTRVRRNIGGDEQRILSLSTQYADATFKHVLLPVWVAPYRYKARVYQLLVNARTGEVQGERPWSWVKIGAVVLIVCSLIALGVYFSEQQ